MSDAPATRDEEMLARLAELDLAAAEKAHAKMMAAEDAAEIAELGRTYQRMARSLRQTLALKTKLANARNAADARAGLALRRHHATFDTPDHAARVMDLQDAVERVATVAIDDLLNRMDVLERFDEEVCDWMEAPDFLTIDLDAQVLRACRDLDLPEDLARTWRTLPPAVYPPPQDASAPPSAPTLASPHRESG